MACGASQLKQDYKTNISSSLLLSPTLSHFGQLSADSIEENCINSTFSQSELGECVGFLLLNRAGDETVTVTLADYGAKMVFQSAAVPLPVVRKPESFHRPSDVVEVYHVHCHFSQDTLDVANQMYQACQKHLGSNNILSGNIMMDWNGPHECPSWQLWVETTALLGSVISFLANNHKPGLRYLVHADTDDEYTDHALRLAYISFGDEPPNDGKLNPCFFQPTPNYTGIAHKRHTTDSHFFTMGRKYKRP
eukprot:TRINITY_DN67895_c15_g1_i1.p1 TRINITY_DN67895_c15_g1~~TRINITY_DN67895_c15_g1_i1.p1  ORF type:complete len:250 (+),score=38.55 TRINITY_DN67895_c15_g1_i1:63-812(+)